MSVKTAAYYEVIPSDTPELLEDISHVSLTTRHIHGSHPEDTFVHLDPHVHVLILVLRNAIRVKLSMRVRARNVQGRIAMRKCAESWANVFHVAG